MKKTILTFSILILSLAGPLAHAQDAQITEETDFSAGSDILFNTDQEKNEIPADATIVEEKPFTSDDAEITIMEDEFVGQYTDPTVQNISKLLWHKDALELTNNVAIDNFLRINECEIYKKFYSDDFEWSRVREAARGMLKDNKDSFPQKFKIVVPIDLGRYDMERKGFPLINNTAFKDLRRVEIGGNNDAVELCGKSGPIPYYPRNLILILNRPFTYEFLNLDEHIAQAYIIRQKYGEIERPEELRNKNYERLAFARIRIDFSEFQGITRGADNSPLGIMFGKLDGIDIFEDADEKHLLKSISF